MDTPTYIQVKRYKDEIDNNCWNVLQRVTDISKKYERLLQIYDVDASIPDASIIKTKCDNIKDAMHQLIEAMSSVEHSVNKAWSDYLRM